MRGRGARLEGAGERGLERGHRDRDPRETIGRHGGQEVEVAHDGCRLGDDRHRMAALRQHLEDAAGDLELALERLVGVGVGAERDRPAAVPRVGELALEDLCRVVLGEQPGLEIEPGRQAEVSVGRPRVAIDAAVLAAAIGVDRLLERDVGRGVARDHRAALVGDHLGRRGRGLGLRLGERAPAVVERLERRRLEAVGGVVGRAAALVRRWIELSGHLASLGRHQEHNKNKPAARTLVDGVPRGYGRSPQPQETRPRRYSDDEGGSVRQLGVGDRRRGGHRGADRARPADARP